MLINEIEKISITVAVVLKKIKVKRPIFPNNGMNATNIFRANKSIPQ